MPASAALTPREVAELAGVPRRAIEKAIEEKALTVSTGDVPAVRYGKGVGMRRLLGPESVAYAVLMSRFGKAVALALPAKRQLARKLRGRDLAALKTAQVEIAPAVTADVGAIAGAELARTERYMSARERWIESVEAIKGGLPVIRGTRISVHSVASRLKGGDTLEEIAAENPDLPVEAFEAAALFARSHPLVGRPTGLPRRAA